MSPLGFRWERPSSDPSGPFGKAHWRCWWRFLLDRQFSISCPQWVASPYSPGLSRTLPPLASAGYVAVLGLYSNTWFRSALESDGWKLVGMTHMKRPQPPEQVGEWVVREYALITWPVNDPPQKPTARSPNAAGYLVGQHERDTTRWTLIPADRSWSALEEVLFDSQQEARTLAEERHPVLQGQWRVMAG